MKTSDFDYDLPESFIAQEPAEPRDSSRLMVIDRHTRTLEHRTFREIVDYIRPGDVLVANESRVIPARLFARKASTGGRVELLLLSRRDELTWEALVKGRKTPVGTRLLLYEPDDGDPITQPGLPDTEAKTAVLQGEVIAWTQSGGRLIRWGHPIEDYLERLGVLPLPPYIHTPLSDPNRYQTVYARTPGSVAAPTAGLHFTPGLLLALREMGVRMTYVTLDIGLDTFRPVQTENVEEHHMHTERCSIDAETARQINQARLEGHRIVAVGTTSVRVLESAAAQPSFAARCGWRVVQAFEGRTDLFIYPGFEFRVTDALITNFHLPRSSLLMLVSGFAGRELILQAYEEAKRKGYRFYSFGDTMLIL